MSFHVRLVFALRLIRVILFCFVMHNACSYAPFAIRSAAQVATGAVVGVQLIGAFAVGEYLARGELFGYPDKNAVHHH